MSRKFTRTPEQVQKCKALADNRKRYGEVKVIGIDVDSLLITTDGIVRRVSPKGRLQPPSLFALDQLAKRHRTIFPPEPGEVRSLH